MQNKRKFKINKQSHKIFGLKNTSEIVFCFFFDKKEVIFWFFFVSKKEQEFLLAFYKRNGFDAVRLRRAYFPQKEAERTKKNKLIDL